MSSTARSRFPFKKRRGRHSKRNGLISAITIFISFAFVGWVAVTNVRNPGNTYHSNTADVISSRQKRISELQKDIDSTAQKIDTLQRVMSGSNADSTTSDSASNTFPQIEGKGVTVTLDDSQRWEQAARSKDANPNDYVVHQQDIEAVVNAMWAGGAEAITIQDQRLMPTSAIKCIGNVLLLNGKQFAPPYKISAIGDIDMLSDTINNSEAVKIYKQYVDADGLGWKFETNQNLNFEEVTVPAQTMKYASTRR
ncbi:DUF881 domain-containing protein [Alloscardovia theropitheci]|uniref:DUF881 domain-containing protein n=1 Tax=Alloscardovia theropitheci TaxID=2496842 RepID=A0A4R0QT10_9BIFI|nr:DUF881 domain-containing protein [Alloscardovia theropitheci]TCD54345.1 DUF881 domain-containing protein [Alloscardovia theropitheci]